MSNDCMSFRYGLLDGAVTAEFLKALQAAEIGLALAALQDLESRDRARLVAHKERCVVTSITAADPTPGPA